MEYQQAKEAILSSVEYTNLLSFTLVENKLERNFKLLVQALGLTQTNTDSLAAKIDLLAGTSTSQNQAIGTMQEQISTLHEKLALLQNQQREVKNIEGIPKPIEIFSPQKEPILEKPSPAKECHLKGQLIELTEKVNEINEVVPTVRYLEEAIDSAKRQISLLKGQLATINIRSFRQMKRESIGQSVLHTSQSALNQEPSKKELPSVRQVLSKQVISLHKINSIHQVPVETPKYNKENQNEIQETFDQSAFDRELNGLHVEVNTLNILMEELKQAMSDLTKKQVKTGGILSQLNANCKKMQNNHINDFEALQKQVKDLSVFADNLKSNSTDEKKERKAEKAEKSTEKTEKIEKSEKTEKTEKYTSSNESENCRDKMNDRISKLQATLNSLVTEEEFNRFKAQARDRTDSLEKVNQTLKSDFEAEIKMLRDLIAESGSGFQKVTEIIESVKQNLKDSIAQADRKHNIAISKVEEGKKNLQNLREDVQYYQSLNKEKPGKEEGKGQSSEKKSETIGVDGKCIEQLKRMFTNKLHDQRAYFIGQIRDLQKKLTVTSSIQSQLTVIWDKVNQINALICKKADAEDTRKNLTYLEKKIVRLATSLVKKAEDTDDARVAKTNWLCLSCDKGLNNYQGRVGKHIVWEAMPSKGKSKQIFPSLKKP